MKLPKSFRPDKDLENKIKEYLKVQTLGDLLGNEEILNLLNGDPNLIYVLSAAVILSRLPRTDMETKDEIMYKLTDAMKKNDLKSFAKELEPQKGIGKKELEKTLARLNKEYFKGTPSENALDILEDVITKEVKDQTERGKYIRDLAIARELYNKKVKEEMFNAYMNEVGAVKRDVMRYVMMVIGRDSEYVNKNGVWEYKDPATEQMKSIQIDQKYMDVVEDRLGLKSHEQKEAFETTIIKIFAQKINTDPNYDFMDNYLLVEAVTDVRLKSDIGGAGSLIGALANKREQDLHKKIVDTMVKTLGYSKECAKETIEYYIKKK